MLATQNPIEMEGTYPLPEAQLDRFFFKLLVEFPTRTSCIAILDRTTGADDADAAAGDRDGARSSRCASWSASVPIARADARTTRCASCWRPTRTEPRAPS